MRRSWRVALPYLILVGGLLLVLLAYGRHQDQQLDRKQKVIASAVCSALNNKRAPCQQLFERIYFHLSDAQWHHLTCGIAAHLEEGRTRRALEDAGKCKR
jgi:hypothetical protein